MAETLRKQHENYTVRLIEDSFIKLYEDKGLDVSVREICETAGISRPVFYRLYDDKYDVLEKIENRLIEDLKKINDRMPAAAYSSRMEFFPYVEESAEYVYSNRAYFKPLICQPGDMGFINKWCRLLRNDIMRRLDYENRAPDNVPVYTYGIAKAAIGIYEYWLKSGPDMSTKEISGIITKLWSILY